MTKEKQLPWFQCYPEKLLGALSALDADSQLVYVTLLLRIYENGGPVDEDAETLSNRTKLPVRKVKAAMEKLLARKKLITEDGLISNPQAEEVLKIRQSSAEERKLAAKTAANSRWKKTEQVQQNGNASAMPGDAYLDSDRDKERKKTDSPRSSRSRRPRHAGDYSSEFENLWSIYPRTAGTSKKDAFKNWLKLTDEDRATVIRTMPAWIGLMRGREQDKIRHLEVFLNKRIFETLESATTAAAAQPGVSDPAKFSDDRWKSLLKVYAISNNWHQKHGPPPGKPGCLVPSKLFSEERQPTVDMPAGAVH